MGHQHLPPLQRTRAWSEVVGLLAAGASVPQVAIASVRAALLAFERLHQDAGSQHTLRLLLQLTEAAREDDLHRALYDRGLHTHPNPGILDLAVALTDAIDARLANNCRRTDLGEMAQLAGAEALVEHLNGRSATLFGCDPDMVKASLAQLYSAAHFGTFARLYFGRLVFRVLNYYLARVLGEQVGAGRRFMTLTEARDFQSALRAHCAEAATVVVRFTEESLGRERGRGQPLSPQWVADYSHGAVTKIMKVFHVELGEPTHAA